MSVFITGIGVVSAIGSNVEENFRSLQNENSGIQSLQFLKSDKNFLAGEVKFFRETIKFGFPIDILHIKLFTYAGLFR